MCVKTTIFFCYSCSINKQRVAKWYVLSLEAASVSLKSNHPHMGRPACQATSASLSRCTSKTRSHSTGFTCIAGPRRPNSIIQHLKIFSHQCSPLLSWADHPENKSKTTHPSLKPITPQKSYSSFLTFSVYQFNHTHTVLHLIVPIAALQTS